MIKNSVFDLGAVLIHWHPQEMAQQFTQDEAQAQLVLEQVFHHEDWKRLDLGHISEAEARQCFARNTGLPRAQIDDLMEFIRAYLQPKPQSVALLHELKAQGHRIFCLSNICQELYQHLSAQHDFFSAFDDVVVSARIKLAKPDPAIFHHMLTQFDIKPEETLFIDDMAANVASAQSLGIHAVQFHDIKDCRERVLALIEDSPSRPHS